MGWWGFIVAGIVCIGVVFWMISETKGAETEAKTGAETESETLEPEMCREVYSSAWGDQRIVRCLDLDTGNVCYAAFHTDGATAIRCVDLPVGWEDY